MDLLQGALLTGAAATGVVVVERVRHRGASEAVREDVAKFGGAVAEQIGKLAGFVTHSSGWVLGRSARVADGVGDKTAQVVTAAGRTVARGAGVALGAYAGMIDRVVPWHHGDGEAVEVVPVRTTRPTRTTKAAQPGERVRTAKAS